MSVFSECLILSGGQSSFPQSFGAKPMPRSERSFFQLTLINGNPFVNATHRKLLIPLPFKYAKILLKPCISLSNLSVTKNHELCRCLCDISSPKLVRRDSVSTCAGYFEHFPHRRLLLLPVFLFCYRGK